MVGQRRGGDARLRGCPRPAGPQPLVHILSRFPWRSHRTCHPLRVADDPDDRKLLPQGQQEPQQSCLVGHHLRSLDRCDLRGARADSDGDIRSFRPQRTRHKRRLQRSVLPAARGIRDLLYGRLRNHTPRKMDQQDGLQGGQHHRLSFALLHGVHACARILLLHRPDHRYAPCGSRLNKQLHIACDRNVRLRSRACHPLLAVRDFPDNAQVG